MVIVVVSSYLILARLKRHCAARKRLSNLGKCGKITSLNALHCNYVNKRSVILIGRRRRGGLPPMCMRCVCLRFAYRRVKTFERIYTPAGLPAASLFIENSRDNARGIKVARSCSEKRIRWDIPTAAGRKIRVLSRTIITITNIP